MEISFTGYINYELIKDELRVGLFKFSCDNRTYVIETSGNINGHVYSDSCFRILWDTREQFDHIFDEETGEVVSVDDIDWSKIKFKFIKLVRPDGSFVRREYADLAPKYIINSIVISNRYIDGYSLYDYDNCLESSSADAQSEYRISSSYFSNFGAVTGNYYNVGPFVEFIANIGDDDGGSSTELAF